MSTTQILLNDVQQGVPSGNYDGSSLDFASDAAAGPGYYQGNAGTQTVAVRVANFDGRIQLQGTLDCLPGDGTNWVSLAEFDTSDSAATYTEIVTVTGQFVWIRARVLNFLDGTIDSVTSTYAGAGADIGGGSDVTAGVFSSVTANAVYVGTTGVVSSGNITAPYFLGNGSQLTGIAGLDSFSVSTLPAAGDGALVYNSANGVFQFTPADAGASDYGNANVVAYAESGWAGNIVPAADDQYSLGNATNQWSELWVSNTTIYIGGVPVGITGNVLTVNGEPVLQNDSASSITTTGNITANYFIGNGSQLTGLPESYGNANVAAYLPTYSGNVSGLAIQGQNISTTGNNGNLVRMYFRPNEPRFAFGMTVGNVFANVFNITDTGADTTGNITANYFIGNGSQLTGLPESYGNANVATFLAAFGSNTVSTTGNITAGNVQATSYRNSSGGPILGDYVFANNIIETNNGDGGIQLQIFGPDQADPPALINQSWLFGNTGAFYSPGNVVAPNFVGNGLFNGTTGIAIPTANSNIYVGFGLVGSIEFNAQGVTALNLAATGNVTGARANISGNVTAGNILTDNYRYANGDPFVSSSTGNLEITGTMIEFAAGATEELITVSPDGFAGQAVLQLPNNATANVYDTILTNSGGNVKISSGDGVAVYDWLFGTDGVLTAPGNISGTNFIVSASLIGSDASPQPTISGFSTISATGNITGGNLLTAGNVTANYFVGNGSALTGLTYSQVGNIVGDQANVTLVAGSYDWTFDNTGNAAFANGTVSVTDIDVSNIVAFSYESPGANTAIDITKQVSMLSGDANISNVAGYTLANGTEGQVLFVTWNGVGVKTTIEITANLRNRDGNQNANTWKPFDAAGAEINPTNVTLIFSNGYWTTGSTF